MYQIRVEKIDEVFIEIQLSDYREAWSTYRWHCEHAKEYNTYVEIVETVERRVLDNNNCLWKQEEQPTVSIEK